MFRHKYWFIANIWLTFTKWTYQFSWQQICHYLLFLMTSRLVKTKTSIAFNKLRWRRTFDQPDEKNFMKTYECPLLHLRTIHHNNGWKKKEKRVCHKIEGRPFRFQISCMFYFMESWFELKNIFSASRSFSNEQCCFYMCFLVLTTRQIVFSRFR